MKKITDMEHELGMRMAGHVVRDATIVWLCDDSAKGAGWRNDVLPYATAMSLLTIPPHQGVPPIPKGLYHFFYGGRPNEFVFGPCHCDFARDILMSGIAAVGKHRRLKAKATDIKYWRTDPETGKPSQTYDLSRHIDPETGKWSYDPDWQFDPETGKPSS